MKALIVGAGVTGCFPGVGGTWEGDRLAYADLEKAGDARFDRLILGEAHILPRGLNVMRWIPAALALAGPSAGAELREVLGAV